MVSVDSVSHLECLLTELTDASDACNESGQLELSVVIPAKNELQRLPDYLDSIREYFTYLYDEKYEIIVVENCSTDGLFEQLVELKSSWPQLVPLQHQVNLGKGAAVKTGVLASRGRRILFTDADGATPIHEELKLSRLIQSGSQIAMGTRAPGQSDSKCTRACFRNLIGKTFSSLTRLFCSLSYTDTQCGFKMFSRESALRLFQLCDEPGFLLTFKS